MLLLACTRLILLRVSSSNILIPPVSPDFAEEEIDDIVALHFLRLTVFALTTVEDPESVLLLGSDCREVKGGGALSREGALRLPQGCCLLVFALSFFLEVATAGDFFREDDPVIEQFNVAEGG